MELFTYLLKVSGCMAAFYIVYYVMFRKLTFFTLNRWYLLSALAISLVIPAVHIQMQTIVPMEEKAVELDQPLPAPALQADVPVIIQQQAAPINWLKVTTFVYLAVVAVLLLKLFITLIRISSKAIKKGSRQNGYYLVPDRDNSSFFNYIFLNDEGLNQTEKEQVIAHELIHARLFHSIDNLFIEVLKTALWFNPFIYLFSKALHQVHEYEVDRSLTNRYDAKNYAGLLLKLSSPGTAVITNQFSAYGLKSRVTMLFNRPSAAAKKLSYVLVLPLLGTMTYYLAVEKVYAYSQTDKGFTLVLDAGHGGKEGGAETGGYREKDINLQLVKAIKAVADQRGIHTILTRADDHSLLLRERLIPKGDLFVSVHVNAESGHSDQNGIRILIDKRNSLAAQSRKLAQTFVKDLNSLNGITTADTIADNQHIFVLSNNTVPSALVSIGFMTNKNDLAYITNNQNQHDIAVKFVEALIDYKKGGSLNYKSGQLLHQPKNNITKTVKSLNYAKQSVPTVKSVTRADTNKLPYSLYIIHSNTMVYSGSDGSLHLTGALVKYGQYAITANDIKYNRTDSTITAAGKVELVDNHFKGSSTATMTTDSLVFNLKPINWRAYKPLGIIKSADKQ